ncbi:MULTISPECIES: hypothetical protein [unclassified Pseudomonas]|uniref:hypothetical protein n=1 Tax=unclassified Pseudomonas TaxID=196821 RepID=UPI001CBDF9E2|nr:MULTISPECIES: hypothetical protein [unclassified Pseudomonas]
MTTHVADTYEKTQALLGEYEALLIDGLGDAAKSYEMACVPLVMGLENVGIAFSLEEERVYVLCSDEGRPDIQYLPTYLLDMAKFLTDALPAFVVPDQGGEFAYWGDSQRGRFIVYKFKMDDSPGGGVTTTCSGRHPEQTKGYDDE